MRRVERREFLNRHSRGTWLNNLLYNIHLLVGKIASPGNAALSITGQPNGGNSVPSGLADSLNVPSLMGLMGAAGHVPKNDPKDAPPLPSVND